jgi:hypothetical protein
LTRRNGAGRAARGETRCRLSFAHAVSSVRGRPLSQKMSSRSRRTVAKTSSQTTPTANHLQPIRAIRVESGEPRRSLTQVFQIFFHRRLRAFQPPPGSQFGAAGTSRGGVKQ